MKIYFIFFFNLLFFLFSFFYFTPLLKHFFSFFYIRLASSFSYTYMYQIRFHLFRYIYIYSRYNFSSDEYLLFIFLYTCTAFCTIGSRLQSTCGHTSRGEGKIFLCLKKRKSHLDSARNIYPADLELCVCTYLPSLRVTCWKEGVNKRQPENKSQMRSRPRGKGGGTDFQLRAGHHHQRAAVVISATAALV